MPSVDLSFNASGTHLQLDHGYSLYSAISRVIGPISHDPNGVGIHSIQGIRVGYNMLQLTGDSRLRVRTPVALISPFLKLAGQTLKIDTNRISLGVPQTYPLSPSPTLVSKLVTIKGFDEKKSFIEAVQRQLDLLSISGNVTIPDRDTGPHAGNPMRRVIKIKDKTVVGFTVLISELTMEDSVILQERGIGGRRHMGCGIFIPASKRCKV